MQYVTSIERLGMEKVLKQGFRQSVLDVLTTRFAQVSQSLVTAVNALDDESVLRRLLTCAATSPSVDEFTALLEQERQHLSAA